MRTLEEAQALLLEMRRRGISMPEIARYSGLSARCLAYIYSGGKGSVRGVSPRTWRGLVKADKATRAG